MQNYIQENNNAGEIASIARYASAFPIHLAKGCANTANAPDTRTPLVKRSAYDVLYIPLAFLLSPLSLAEDMSIDTAIGNPDVETPHNRAYIS